MQWFNINKRLYLNCKGQNSALLGDLFNINKRLYLNYHIHDSLEYLCKV